MQHELMKRGTAEADRDRGAFSTQFSSVGRSDDARRFRVCDLVRPQTISVIGPSPCQLLPIVTKDGKTQENGRLAYCGVIRSEDPLECMQDAIGYHAVHRWTIRAEPFPMPDDPEAWSTTALFQGSSPRQCISYPQLYASCVGVFAAVGIAVAKKTHAFRVAGAQRLDAQGVDDMVIARFGRWLYAAMYKSYLMFFKPEGLLAMGRWPRAAQKDFQTYWHP